MQVRHGHDVWALALDGGLSLSVRGVANSTAKRAVSAILSAYPPALARPVLLCPSWYF